MRFFSTLTQQFPFLAPVAASLTQAISATAIQVAPEWTYQQLLKSMMPRDRAIFQNHPELKAVFITGIADTYRQGIQGGIQEGLMAYRSWGFQLQDISTQAYVWHGEDDEIAHPAIGRYLAKTIPNCRAMFVPDAGHFLAFTHWREIVSQLIMD